MNTRLDLRYIPSWLGNAVKHYGGGVNEFNRIVSKHDLKLYHLANNLLRAKLRTMQMVDDFELIDAEIDFTYSADDVKFALFGQNPKDLEPAEFEVTQFRVVDDTKGGIWLIEDADVEPCDLAYGLLKAIALYKGEAVAYGSASFKRYLRSVKNEPMRNVA